MLDLYKNIKKFRIERKLSQAELAKLTGYTDRSSIAKIEKGDVDLPQSKIMLFAEALGVDAGTLMGDTGLDTPSPYYLDPDAARSAQEAFDDHDLRALFDAARDSKADDIRMATDMLRRFKETNPDG